AGKPEVPELPLPEEEPPPAALPPMAAFTALRNPSIVYPIPRPFQRCSGSPWLDAIPRLWPSRWLTITPSAVGFRLYCLHSMANSSTAASQVRFATAFAVDRSEQVK